MAGFWFEARQVMRSVRRQPGFFAIAALTLGVGFAAHFAAFGIVDRLLLSYPAHVQDGSRVFRLHVDRSDVAGGRFTWWQTPYSSYQDLRQHARVFSGMAAYRTTRGSVGTDADARMITVTFADAQYFPTLGVSARLGRVFGAEDDLPPAGNPVLVLSDAYWRSAYGAEVEAIGRTLHIGTRTFTIVGVAPPGFTGDTLEPVDAWAPLHTGVNELPASWSTSYLFRSVNVLARLAPGTTQAAAAADAGALYRRAVEGTPAADATARVLLASLSPGRGTQGTLTPQGRIAVWLEGVSLIVLLVAIANVVNLQMSRAVQQRRELAVRVALGADRRRLLSRLGLEMLAIAAAGAAAGLALTWWTSTAMQQLLLAGMSPGIDGPRFASMAIVTMAITAAIVVGLASLQLRTEAVGERLKSGRGGDGFSRARLRQGLLVAQVVMSALLLVCAGLFVRSIVKVDRLQFGIDPDRVLAVTLPLRGAGYSNAAAEDFYARALAELATVPGIQGAAAAQSTPFSPSQRSEIFVRGYDHLPLPTGEYPTYYTITPSYFDVMGMRLLRGRAFTDADRGGAPPVIIVEEALARTLWPGQDAIGKCIIIGAANEPCRDVVGVSSSTRRFVGTAAGALRYYVPMGQRVNPAPPQALLVRAAGDPVALVPSVRAALLRAAQGLPYAQIRVLRELAEPETRPWRLGSTLFVAFGAAAMLVATLGVYALLSFVVMQRSREIGVRLALGASPARTLRMIVGQSLTWVAAGVMLGLTVALAAGRFVEPLLFETSPYDPAVFTAAAAVLLAVATAASLVPAIRASRVDPNVTLRAE